MDGQTNKHNMKKPIRVEDKYAKIYFFFQRLDTRVMDLLCSSTAHDVRHPVPAQPFQGGSQDARDSLKLMLWEKTEQLHNLLKWNKQMKLKF